MTTQAQIETCEASIRKVLDAWAEVKRAGTRNAVLSNHVSSVVIFDVLPPLCYDATTDYKKSWDQWQPDIAVPSLFDIHDLEIVSDDEIGFA